MKLFENQNDIQGFWWDPERPKTKWHGVLSLMAGQQGQLRLTYMGRSISAFGGYPDMFKMLHGTSSDGKAITLLQGICREHVRTMGSEEARYDAFAVVFSTHLDNDMFDGVEVEFDYLNDWMTYTRFQTREDTAPDEGAKEIRIRLNPKHSYAFESLDYAKAAFFLGYRMHSTGFTFSIENRTNLQFTYRETRSFRDMWRDIRQWRSFFALATDKSVGIVRLTVYRNEDRFDLGDTSYASPLNVWMASESIPDRKSLHDFQMAFTFPQIENNLSPILAQWKDMQTSWAPVLQGYFASLHRPELRLDEIFLSRARAIEALNWIRSDKALASEAFIRAWDGAPAGLQAFLGDRAEFAAMAQKYRNYLVHLNPSDEPNDPTEQLLFELGQKLEFILKVAVLEKMGVAETIIEKAYERRRWRQWVAIE